MPDMGERPLYLQKHITRHGKVAWYVRVRRGKLIRLRAAYGSEAFWDEYRAALGGVPLPNPKPNSASLQWLYDRYRESMAWSNLSRATRRQRENILLHVMEKAGTEAFLTLDSAAVEAGLDDRRATPAQARNYLDAVRGLFKWAKANKHVPVDPTASVERPQRVRDDEGHKVWSEEDVTAYRKKWLVGSRERLWFELLYATGLRRGDVVRVGKQHIRDGILSIKTEKTGMEVNLPLDATILKLIEIGPTADLALVCGKNGKPLTKETFGNFFRQACMDAGVKVRAHGVRKHAATLRADHGYTEAELEAHFGWTGGYMASLYTRSANRKKLAKDAAKKLKSRDAKQTKISA